jgi:hypothetical protein
LTNFAVLILFYQNSLTLLTAGTSSQSQPWNRNINLQPDKKMRDKMLGIYTISDTHDRVMGIWQYACTLKLLVVRKVVVLQTADLFRVGSLYNPVCLIESDQITTKYRPTCRPTYIYMYNIFWSELKLVTTFLLNNRAQADKFA